MSGNLHAEALAVLDSPAGERLIEWEARAELLSRLAGSAEAAEELGAATFEAEDAGAGMAAAHFDDLSDEVRLQVYEVARRRAFESIVKALGCLSAAAWQLRVTVDESAPGAVVLTAVAIQAATHGEAK